MLRGQNILIAWFSITCCFKDLLSFNGFENTKRQDYYNKEFGLVLEDMHDENVIARQDVLFFIDTVFYIMAI